MLATHAKPQHSARQFSVDPKPKAYKKGKATDKNRDSVKSGRGKTDESKGMAWLESPGTRDQSQRPHAGKWASAKSMTAPPSLGRNAHTQITVSLKSRRSRRFLLHTPLGEFQVVRTLGQGSYGKVRLMRSALTQHQYAVKIIRRYAPHKHHRSHPEHRKAKTLDRRVAREANLAAILGQLHPNIVPLHDFRVTDTHLYLFYDFVDGETLSEKIGSGGLDEPEAKRIFHSLANTISFCHRYSIIHRDIKLENILLDNTQTPPMVKLIDFGLANFFDRKGLMETFCGSLPYTSPEILRGDAYIGPEVDVWSLGVLLYVMITACFPFEDPSQPKNYDLIMAGDFKLRSSMSLDLRNLLRRMIEPRINKRISMEEVLAHPWLEECRSKDEDESASVFDTPNATTTTTMSIVNSETNISSNGSNSSRDRTSLSNVAASSSVAFQLPINTMAAHEVAVCLDMPYQKVLQKLPGYIETVDDLSSITPTSESTCQGDVVVVPNSPVVSVYSLILHQMEKRLWYSGIPNPETTSMINPTHPPHLGSNNNNPNIQRCYSEPNVTGNQYTASHSGTIVNDTSRGPQVRSLGFLHDTTGRIVLPSALSSLPPDDILKKLKRLLNLHQIVSTFVETRHGVAKRSGSNSTLGKIVESDLLEAFQKKAGPVVFKEFWTSLLSLMGKSDTHEATNSKSRLREDDGTKYKAVGKTKPIRHAPRRLFKLLRTSESGDSQAKAIDAVDQIHYNSAACNVSKSCIKTPTSSPVWDNCLDTKEAFCPVTYPTSTMIAQYSPSLSRKRNIEVIEHYSCSVHIELVQLPMIPHLQRYALVIKRMAGHQGKFELFQTFMQRMVPLLQYINTQ